MSDVTVLLILETAETERALLLDILIVFVSFQVVQVTTFYVQIKKTETVCLIK